MRKKVFASILISVYNTEDYLKQCLDSVIRQSDEDIEIIIVDDASTDGSLAIIAEYEKRDSRIKTFFHSENRGMFVSRNTAICNASGEYYIFVDSDDFIEPDYVETIRRLTEKNKIDIINFRTEVESDEMRRIEKFFFSRQFRPLPGSLKGNKVFDAFLFKERIPFNIWGKAFHHSLFSKAGRLNCSISQAEDFIRVCILFSHAESYYGSRRVMYHYNYGRGSLGKKEYSLPQYRQYCQDMNDGLNFLMDYFQKKMLADIYFRRLQQIRICYMYITFQLLHSVKEGFQYEALNDFTQVWGKENVNDFIAQTRIINTFSPVYTFFKNSLWYFSIFKKRWYNRMKF